MQKIGIFLICLVTMQYAQAQCPPVIEAGKLHGILPVVDQQVTYREVAECGSVSQADLFRRARLWLIQSATSQDPLALSDKETGDLMSRETVLVRLPRSEDFAGGVYTLHYWILIECANRKYRATLTQIDVVDTGTNRLVPLETYCMKSDKEDQLFYVELDKQLVHKMTQLQTAVKAYSSF